MLNTRLASPIITRASAIPMVHTNSPSPGSVQRFLFAPCAVSNPSPHTVPCFAAASWAGHGPVTMPLERLGAEHPYGPGCYGVNGCAALIEGEAAAINARQF